LLIDASALTAIFASEDDAEHLLRLLEKARVRAISPLGIWESALALARIFARPTGGVTADLELFFERLDIRVLPVTAERPVWQSSPTSDTARAATPRS
jgi:uncharacterized protein with PIN domain